MRPLILTIISIILMLSCNKHTDTLTINHDDDPIWNESFGRVLDHETGSIVIWDKNSEFFLSTTTNGAIKTDRKTLSREMLLSKETSPSLTQISADNTSAIFVGSINNQFGFYSVDFVTKNISTVLSMRKDQSAAVYAGSHDMFYYIGDVIEEGRPCENWDDFFCGVHTTTINLKLIHKLFSTNNEVELNPALGFASYSPDGSIAIFRSYTDSAFIFNTTTQTWQDSMPLLPNPLINSFRWINNTIQYLSWQPGSNDIVINDLTTHSEIKRFQSSLQITGMIGWSADARKIFYTGACTTPGCTYAINQFDLSTMSETQIVTTTYTALQTSPFQATPSPDGNYLVFTDGYYKFFKELK